MFIGTSFMVFAYKIHPEVCALFKKHPVWFHIQIINNKELFWSAINHLFSKKPFLKKKKMYKQHKITNINQKS